MKRYFLFAGDIYYPSQGITSLVADHNSLEECIKIIKDELSEEKLYLFNNPKNIKHCWAHVFDTKVGVIVWILTDDGEV